MNKRKRVRINPSDADKVRQRILELETEGYNNDEIAAKLNAEGFGELFEREIDRLMVSQRRWHYKQNKDSEKRRGPGRPRGSCNQTNSNEWKPKKVILPKACPRNIEIILGDSEIPGKMKWKFIRAILLNK